MDGGIRPKKKLSVYRCKRQCTAAKRCNVALQDKMKSKPLQQSRCHCSWRMLHCSATRQDSLHHCKVVQYNNSPSTSNKTARVRTVGLKLQVRRSTVFDEGSFSVSYVAVIFGKKTSINQWAMFKMTYKRCFAFKSMSNEDDCANKDLSLINCCGVQMAWSGWVSRLRRRCLVIWKLYNRSKSKR